VTALLLSNKLNIKKFCSFGVEIFHQEIRVKPMSLNHLYEDTSQGSGDGAGVSIEILGDQLDLYILGYPGRRYRKQQEKVCELI